LELKFFIQATKVEITMVELILKTKESENSYVDELMWKTP